MSNLTYYSFSKRSKSTAQPTGGTLIDVQLKGGTDLLSPTFLLNISGVPSFNYVSFEGRYYFVKGINNVRNDLWEINCEEDYLATWKSEIGSTSCDILYATGGRNDIMDKRIPTTEDIIVERSEASFATVGTSNIFPIVDDKFGSVILSITGIGSFGDYLVNEEDVPFLLRDADVYASNYITDAATGFQQFFSGGAAGECLKNALAIPVKFGILGIGTFENLYLGNYPCTDANGNPIRGLRIEKPIIKADVDITIPWHYNDWRRHSPYTSLFMYLPFFGDISLPTDDLFNDTTIMINYSLNVTSGDLSYELIGQQSGRHFSTGSTNISMDIPFGSSNVSGLKTVSALAPGIGAAAAVGIGALTGGIGLAAGMTAIGGGLTASAIGLANNANGETYGGGSLSGGASQGIEKKILCYSVSRKLTETQANLDPLIGKPVMKKATIGSYSGFIQTGSCQIAGNMLDSEREMINELCNGGFYYE